MLFRSCRPKIIRAACRNLRDNLYARQPRPGIILRAIVQSARPEPRDFIACMNAHSIQLINNLPLGKRVRVAPCHQIGPSMREQIAHHPQAEREYREKRYAHRAAAGEL